MCVLYRYVAIGSKTVQGKAWLNGSVQDFAYQSYNICCGKGDVWGDGVTPLECALGEAAHETGQVAQNRFKLLYGMCRAGCAGVAITFYAWPRCSWLTYSAGRPPTHKDCGMRQLFSLH